MSIIMQAAVLAVTDQLNIIMMLDFKALKDLDIAQVAMMEMLNKLEAVQLMVLHSVDQDMILVDHHMVVLDLILVDIAQLVHQLMLDHTVQDMILELQVPQHMLVLSVDMILVDMDKILEDMILEHKQDMILEHKQDMILEVHK
jgi:hypothetical protein